MREGQPIMCYGDDGPAYPRACPTCARFVKMPDKAFVNGLEEAIPIVAHCSKCGPVTIENIGWTADYQETQ